LALVLTRSLSGICAREGVMDGDVLNVLRSRPILQKNHVYFTITDKK
jgi:hypothetical protein